MTTTTADGGLPVPAGMRRAAAELARLYAPGYPPTHPHAGADSERASVGDPGHCEVCAILGHVAAHPDYGCGDVQCTSDHDEPVTAELADSFRRAAERASRPVAGRLFVPGKPITQGSKDYKGRNTRGKAILVESADGLAEWRQRIAWAGHGHGWRPYDGPCSVDLEFVVPRPVSTPKRRTPPAIRKPDVDKLLRAVLDALTGVAWTDDARVIDTRARKRLAELDETPGVYIAITRLEV